jgi:hypothetical protein
MFLFSSFFCYCLAFFSIDLGKTIVIVGKKLEHSSRNEKWSLDIFMNEVEMNNERFEERSENISNLQIETNRISQPKNEK